MPEKLSITTIIPTFNAEEFLAETIESVQNQTRPPAEIIVVDDCSTDNTLLVASSYRVKVIQMDQNSGHATARNLAIKQAKHPLIAWIDADDIWKPFHLEEVGELLDQHIDVGVACSPVEMFGRRQGIRKCLQTGRKPIDALGECFAGTCVPAMSAITRTQNVRAIGGFDTSYRIAPDFDFWLRLAKHTAFASTDRVTAKYRMHSDQISSESGVSMISLKQYESMYRARRTFIDRLAEEETNGQASRFESHANSILVRDAKIAASMGNTELLRNLSRIGKEYVRLEFSTRMKLEILKLTPQPIIDWVKARKLRLDNETTKSE